MSEAQVEQLANGWIEMPPPGWKVTYKIDAWGKPTFYLPAPNDAPAPAAAPKKSRP